jgi:hypothetical protein
MGKLVRPKNPIICNLSVLENYDVLQSNCRHASIMDRVAIQRKTVSDNRPADTWKKVGRKEL